MALLISKDIVRMFCRKREDCVAIRAGNCPTCIEDFLNLPLPIESMVADGSRRDRMILAAQGSHLNQPSSPIRLI